MNIARVRVVALVIFIGAIMGSCAPGQQLDIPPVNEVPRLVVMSAFEAELSQLRSQANITGSYVINGRTYYAGQLSGKDVVLVLSGVSMVNAAMTTQTALDHFHVTGIVFSGIAGGVNPNLNIGDVVVPAQWGEYQEQLFARETENGWETGGSTTEFGNYGMMFPQYVGVTNTKIPDQEEQRFWFPVSAEMLAVARKTAVQVQLNKCTFIKICMDQQPRIIVGGNGVSGPTFVDNAAYREWVWQAFKADSLDMESAAVAHVAYANSVPFIAFRSLSDLAGGGPGENEMSTFFQLAADNSATVVTAFLENLPAP
jgi:adenosylhomocysteine nucleosidase